ncbi:hypothetical protein PIB30_100487, partial [Stylosanthes scabra]|nr:hypothetical protein [Stylosanthes scabra]
MDMVMHIMDVKILHHHTHLLKTASKKLFSCYARKEKSFWKHKNESTINNFNNSIIISQPLNSEDLPSQPLSNPRRCIGTLFLCTNQEGREDALLHEEDVESLNHEEVHDSGDLPPQPLSNLRGCIGTLLLCTIQEGREDTLLHEEDVESLNHEEVHECLEEVEGENEYQEAKDVDQEVNVSNLKFIGPQHYGLLETDGQSRALCGVLDKKEVNVGWLNDSRCIMGGVLKLEAQN